MPTPPTPKEFDRAFMQARDRCPSRESWGLYARSDAPPTICGSGQESFMWFSTKDEMVHFTRYIFAWWNPAPSSMKPEQIAEEVQSIVDGWTVGPGNIAKLQDRLNDSMKNIWHIHWWGPFKELTHGDGKFAIEMRKDFLGEDVDLPNDEPPAAIEDSELVE